MKLTNEQRLAKNAQLETLGSSHSSLSEDIHYIATEPWKVPGSWRDAALQTGFVTAEDIAAYEAFGEDWRNHVANCEGKPEGGKHGDH